MKDRNKVMETIVESMNDTSGLFSKSCYGLFFVSKEDGEIYMYDSKNPIKGTAAIMDSNPQLEFLRIEAFPDEGSMRAVAALFRRAREARLKLLAQAETIKVKIELI